MDRNTLTFDFINDKSKYSRPHRGKNELIAKAIGFAKGQRVVLDLTAGMAIDCIFLFKLGCQVTALERNRDVFEALRQAYESAKVEFVKFPGTIQFLHREALNYMQNLNSEDLPDVIYYDPMYPETQKTALPRKEIQIFRELVGYDLDQVEVLKLALTKAKSRVVVKRSLKSPAILENVSHTLEGKLIRYDVYMTHQK